MGWWNEPGVAQEYLIKYPPGQTSSHGRQFSSTVWDNIEDATAALDIYPEGSEVYARRVVRTDWQPLKSLTPISEFVDWGSDTPGPKPRKRIIRSAIRHFRKD